MASELDERKKHILKVITDDYIASAEPVGSRTIARRYNLGLSPATIRNEMADLEESGYLEQPHTSAGRIPSELGYRYYVDALMAHKKLLNQEIEQIYIELEKHHQEIDQVIHQTSKILGQFTKFPSLVLSPQLNSASFRHIQLIRLSETTILVLIVTDTGFVENNVIEMGSGISDSELEQISNFFNSKLRGVCLKEFRPALLNEIRSEMVFKNEFFDEAVKILIRAASKQATERVIVGGTTKILEQPEFADLERFKSFSQLLDEEERLYTLLTPSGYKGAQVKIGHENEETVIQDCSVVTAGYEIAGRTVGVIGVLGPTRMDYAKVMPIVEYTATILSELLTQIYNKTSK
jgi:heat-inducible transcriptional repressor